MNDEKLKNSEEPLDHQSVEVVPKYRNHNTRDVLLSQHYGEHVSAMTTEGLHGKGEIAQELAARDLEIARIRQRIECLRGALQSACGWFYDLDDMAHAEKCLELAGDMELPDGA